MEDIILFEVKEDFTDELKDKFTAFIESLKTPSLVLMDVESYGGYVHVLKSMIQEIEQKKKEGFAFVTHVENYAYSCGFLLYLIGDIKTAGNDSKFMFHPIGFKTDERITSYSAQEMMQQLQVEDDFVYRLFKENTEIDANFFDAIKKNDVFLTKNDLINLKIIKNYEKS